MPSLRAARVVTPEGIRPAEVEYDAGVITAVNPLSGPVGIPDDCVLLPGLVDSHVHVNEPGRTAWEGFATATRAAAAGGVTTIVDMPLNSIPPTVDVPALRAKQAAAQDLTVDVAFWGGAVPGADLEGLHAAGVVGFKCFLLPSGVDEFPPLDASGLHDAMSRIAALDGLLIAHCEDAALVREATGRRYADFVASRPPEAEARAVELLLDTAERTGCRVHVVHLSSAATLPLVRGRANVSVETCPHYLTLAAEDVPDGATQFKCCPPIRDEANRDALWLALSTGDISCVVSDHSPCTPDLKRFDTGDFGQAWGGISSVQLGLPAVWTEAARRGHDLADVARWMSAAPAALANLPSKGALAVGQAADFVVFAPDDTFTVDPATLQHRNPVTPYAGATLRGVVRETYLAGRLVDPAQPAGRQLRRGEA